MRSWHNPRKSVHEEQSDKTLPDGVVGQQHQDIERDPSLGAEFPREHADDGQEPDNDRCNEDLELERGRKIDQRSIATRVGPQSRLPMACNLSGKAARKR
jgi:hypothetical protein